MPRFVILEHDYPNVHWDLMLETTGVLRTWRLMMPPQAGTSQAAMASSDHRVLYLDYEGPISGDRGRVMAWDRGTYEERSCSADRMVVNLHGLRLRGLATLTRLTSETWQLDCASDQ